MPQGNSQCYGGVRRLTPPDVHISIIQDFNGRDSSQPTGIFPVG
jgi:hypothetical protein